MNYHCKVVTIEEMGNPGHKFKGTCANGEKHDTLYSGTTRGLLTSISVNRQKGDSEQWFAWTDQVVRVHKGRGSVHCRVFDDSAGRVYKGYKRVRDGEYTKTTNAIQKNPSLVMHFHCTKVLRLSESSTRRAMSEMKSGIAHLARECNYDPATKMVQVPPEWSYHINVAEDTRLLFQ